MALLASFFNPGLILQTRVYTLIFEAMCSMKGAYFYYFLFGMEAFFKCIVLREHYVQRSNGVLVSSS